MGIKNLKASKYLESIKNFYIIRTVTEGLGLRISVHFSEHVLCSLVTSQVACKESSVR